MRIDGACHCGNISYEAEIDPEAVIICHCTDCQTNSATAFRYGVLVAAADFKLLTGTPKRYLKTAESGRQRALAFCGDCGTQLSFESPKWTINIAIGAFDHPEKIVPALQIGLDTKLPYVDGLADLPDRPPEQKARMAEFYASLVSHQHPDHDTEVWPPKV